MPKLSAQDSVRKAYPSAVLVQLRSEHNRITYLRKRNDHKRLAQVIQDGEREREVTIRDFKDHFHLCPVYYYMDTNAAFVKTKQFAGILLDTDGHAVQNPVINGSSSDYLVVYYGYMLSQGGKPIQTDSSVYTYDPNPPSGMGLVVLNSAFLQLGYFWVLNQVEMLLQKSKKYKYTFVSKRYDICYFPFAKKLHAALLACDSEANVNKCIRRAN